MNNAKNDPVICAGPHLDVRPPKLKLPPKSADCHCHVFGPRDRYPWAANRLYTPPAVLLDDYLAMLRATGFERGVMVQTGLYGPDNRFIVDAVKAHPKQLRAIALIGEDISDRALQDLTDGGVRGFRVNRTAKTDRAPVLAEPVPPTQTIDIHVERLPSTSVLVRVPRTREAHSRRTPSASSQLKSVERKPTVACEPVVSVLTEIAKRLQPGRCVT